MIPFLSASLSHRLSPRLELGVSLRIEQKGTITAILGYSGSGKTTLLRILAGLLNPANGELLCDGDTWFSSQKRISLPPQKRNIGYLAQEPLLFPHWSVEQNLLNIARCSTDQVLSSLHEWELLHLAKQKPAELSGGEKQRVALLQKWIKKPRLLLLDEPFSAMDTSLRRKYRHFLREQLAGKLTTILVTHDMADVIAMADYLAIMHQGKIIQLGTPKEVGDHPVNSAVEELTRIDNLSIR